MIDTGINDLTTPVDVLVCCLMILGNQKLDIKLCTDIKQLLIYDSVLDESNKVK